MLYFKNGVILKHLNNFFKLSANRIYSFSSYTNSAAVPLTFIVIIMNFMKFFSQHASTSFKKQYIRDRKILQFLRLQFYCTSALNKSDHVNEEDVLNKIIYNEVLLNVKKKTEKFEPICLKYLKNNTYTQKSTVTDDKVEKEVVHFPYENTYNAVEEVNECDPTKELFSQSVYNFTPSDSEKIKVPQWTADDYNINLRKLEKFHKWAFSENEEMQDYGVDDVFRFGTCDPHEKVSSVPCGGCGALLHCNDATLPGFIPAEIFKNLKQKDLMAEVCQRCHFLKKFDVALGLNVSPSEYVNLLSSIKEKQALAIIMIDLLDFPCSIFPGILDLIGKNKPAIIVGNKADLLIKDGDDFFQNFKDSFINSLKKYQILLKNVKHVALISAKTGFGVENLIDVIQKNWGNNGDIYLIGCTNVGKSSLFNALLQSDLCKVKAVDILQRATVSSWPGTTLNLLKFPLMKVSESSLITRSRRVKAVLKEEKALQKCVSFTQNIKLEQVPLQGYVGMSFGPRSEISESQGSIQNKQTKPTGLNPREHDFLKSNWFYDTPGVVNQSQIINLLTTSELLLTVPRKMLFPRNFQLKPGSSLFIAGLARLDYIIGPESVWFTVYASMELPLTVTKLEDADYVYQNLLGSPYFRVPVKGKERLSKWPNLESKKFEISPEVVVSQNKLLPEAGVDIVLSSAGWICITVPLAYRCKVEAWTPEGRGIFLRNLPLIKNGHTLRGKQIPDTPAFRTEMQEVQRFSLTDEPPY